MIIPQLSIIVPVYNAASYIDDCLSSIVNQTYKDMEIICVDDGSSDESLNLLRKWELMDSRINVLSQSNKGNSGARNTGLSHAKGRFITFVDSDDMIKPEMYNMMLSKMEAESLDVIGCSYETYPNLTHKSFDIKTGEVINFKELLTSSKTIQTSNDLCFCWRYVFKKGILVNNNIFFREEVIIGEDMIFITEVLSHCERIYLTNKSYYYYRVNNSNSLMSSKSYNPNKASSYNLMYLIKRDQIERMEIDKYTPYSEDLAKYAILVYLPFLIQNEFCNTNNKERNVRIKEIFSLQIISESFRKIGYKNIYSSWNEYIFYLIQKFKIMPIIFLIYNHFYGHKK